MSLCFFKNSPWFSDVPFWARCLWSWPHCLEKKPIYWRKKHNGLPFCTHVRTVWVLLLQRFEPKERLFTTICPFPRKGWGPPGNMFSPHWIPVPDIICLIHLFPARMPYSWQCVDPSGGQQEGGGRQAGWGRWKDGAKNEGSVQRDAAAQPRYWLTVWGEGQELPYTQTSLLTERNFLGARGERAQWLQCRNPVSWVKLCLGARTRQTRTKQARREW